MVNRILGPALTASMIAAPLASQAEGTQEAVQGILCEMPASCVPGSGNITSVSVHPEVSGMTRTIPSMLEVHATCQNIEGFEQFLHQEGIPNTAVRFARGALRWNDPFEQGRPVPARTEDGNSRNMSCRVVGDLYPLGEE